MGDSQAPVMFTLLFGEGAERAQRGASRRLKRWAAAFDEWLAELGYEPYSEQIRREHQESEAGLDPAARGVAEEVAATRLVLRNTFAQASQAQFAPDLIRLVDLYGLGCVRLVRLLSIEGASAGRVLAEFQEAADQVLEELLKEWGWK